MRCLVVILAAMIACLVHVLVLTLALKIQLLALENGLEKVTDSL